MANLKERLLGLIDNGASQAVNLINSMSDTINSIDWDSQFDSLNEMKDSLLKKGNELLGDFNELMKRVKDNITDFEVIVPYDMSIGEKFDHKIENGKLIVEVTYKDEVSERSNKTSVNIPQNCDVDKLTTRYNAVNKTMTVIIPKVIVEPKEEPKEEKKTSTTYKLHSAATPKKKVAEKKEQTPEEHQAASKLLKKFKENTSGMRRAANGRFVKRNAPTE